MKRALSIFLLLILIIAVLVSCVDNNDVLSNDISENSSADTTSDDSSDIISEPEEPRERQTGFADYTNAGPDIRRIAFYDKYTLTVLRDDKAEIYDIAKKKLISTQNFEIFNPENIIINDDRSLTYASPYGSYYKFDNIESETPSLYRNFTEEDLFGDEAEGYSEPDTYRFAGNGKYVRLSGMQFYLGEIGADDDKLVADISELGIYNYCYICDFDGRFVYIGAGSEIIRYDIDTDDVFYVSLLQDAGQSVYNGYVYESEYQNGSLSIYRPGNNFKTDVLLEGDNETFIYGISDLLFTYQQNDAGDPLTVRVYDSEGNLYLRENIVADESYMFVPQADSFEDASAFIIGLDGEFEEEGSRSVYIVINAFDEPIEREFAKSIEDLTREFRKETGFKAYAGESASRWFVDYNTEVCKSKYLIGNVLDVIAEVLNEFPEGFFDELFSGENDYYDSDLEFYIVGNIQGRDAGTISSAIAFTYSEDNKRLIIVDAYTYYSGELRNTIAHELMHCVTDYMTFSDFGDKYAFYDWFDYVPSNAYAYSYVDKYGNDYTTDKYTMADSYDKVYFIDGYSRTFPTEDRSRLFEYMFCPDMAEESGCFEHEHIAKRAAYLASEIRRCFKSVAASDELIWEKTIREYTEYSLAA